ncbi:MAG: hypothetical protein P1V34_13210 [Alphaproteobacteria bacterium]|nr:hypothetical protein [Alphaproteobacteria bacterium]
MFVQNLPALMTLFGTVVLLTVGIILVAGFLPLNLDRMDGGRAAMALLVLITGIALAACGGSLLIWCLRTLPISWSIIAAGLGVLTGPLLFQILPYPLRDRPLGLICIAGLSLAIGFSLLGIDPV